jgi:hypothetical protein
VLIPASSTEYLHVPVTATPNGTDLTGVPVRIAVVSHRADPADTEWHAAEWVGAEARILIGPATALTLTPGDYRVWINIDPPGGENVVRKAGVLSVT